MGGKPLYKLESYPTARELGEGVVIVVTLGVKDSSSWRKAIIGRVVVADDEVHPMLSSVGDFLKRLDPRIYRYDEADT